MYYIIGLTIMLLYRITVKVRRHLFAACLVLCAVIFVVSYIGLHNTGSVIRKPVRQSESWPGSTVKPLAKQTTHFTVQDTLPGNEQAVNNNNQRKLNEVDWKSKQGLTKPLSNGGTMKHLQDKVTNDTAAIPKFTITNNTYLRLNLSRDSESLLSPRHLKTKQLQGTIEKQHELFLKTYKDVVKRNQLLEKKINSDSNLPQNNEKRGKELTAGDDKEIRDTGSNNAEIRGDNNAFQKNSNKYNLLNDNTRFGDNKYTGDNKIVGNNVDKAVQLQQLPYEVQNSFLEAGQSKYKKEQKGSDKQTADRDIQVPSQDNQPNSSMKSAQKGAQSNRQRSWDRHRGVSNARKHSGTKFSELHIAEKPGETVGNKHKGSVTTDSRIVEYDNSNNRKPDGAILTNDTLSPDRTHGNLTMKQQWETVRSSLNTNQAHQNRDTDVKKTLPKFGIQLLNATVGNNVNSKLFKDINFSDNRANIVNEFPWNSQNWTFRNDFSSYRDFIRKVVHKQTHRNQKGSPLDKYIFPVHKQQADLHDSDSNADKYQKHQIHDGLQNFEKVNDQPTNPKKELLYKFQSYEDDQNDEDDGETRDDDNRRPEKCNGCMRLDFKYLINGSSICKKDAKGLDLLILISSDPSNDIARMAIRKSWGEVCHKRSSNIACVFMIANSPNAEQNQMVLQESRRYGDVVVFSFMDAYTNLTYKTLMGMRWSQDYCPQAKFIMKTDQDVYVNTHQLPIMLQAAPSQGFFGGFCWGISPPHRDPGNKWFVSYDQFSNKYFPPMCSGTGYLISRDLVISILKVSPNIPFFSLEDVYIALCLHQLGITPINLQGFSNMRTEFQACEYKYYVMTSHQISEIELTDFWEEMQTCPDYHFKPQDLYLPIPLPDID